MQSTIKDQTTIMVGNSVMVSYLHDKEVGVVHIELDRAEEVLHTRRCGIAAVNQVLVATPNHHLRDPRGREQC